MDPGVVALRLIGHLLPLRGSVYVRHAPPGPEEKPGPPARRSELLTRGLTASQRHGRSQEPRRRYTRPRAGRPVALA